MSDELQARKPCHLLVNDSGTKIFMAFYPLDSQQSRLLIPISLENVIVEKQVSVGNFEYNWIPDNLATVEFQAKQKGLL